MALVAWIMPAAWQASHSDISRALPWLISVAGAGAAVGAIAGGGGVACAVAAAFAVAGTGAPAGAIAVAVAGTSSGIAAIVAADVSTLIIVAMGVGAGVIALTLSLLVQWAKDRQRLGTFWLVFWPLEIALCYVSLWAAELLGLSHHLALFLVMIGLVPLVNAPFDWASVGFTRALLRRGCERDSISPLWLGLIDFLIGLVLLILLAVALIIALHLVDVVVNHAREGTKLINVPNRLIELNHNPSDPANWWIYLTLFSTLIPSALNLLIGMISLVTWSAASQRKQLIRKIALLKKDEPGLDSTRWESKWCLAGMPALELFWPQR